MTLSNATDQHTGTGAYALATSEEIDAVRAILSENGHFPESARVAYLGLEDPRRDEDTVDRRFRVFLLDVAGARPKDVVVSVTNRLVESVIELDTATSGELPVLEEEFEVVEQLLAEDPRWLEALAKRDLDVEKRARRPALRRRFRIPGGIRPAHPARPCLRAEPPGGFGMGAPGRRAGRLRGCDEPQRGPGHRPGRRGHPGRARQLHRPGTHRTAAHHAEADLHHPARGPQLHRHRRQPRRVGKVEPGCRLRRARGPGAAQHFLRGQGPAAAHPQPRLDRRNGRPLRRPLPRAQLAELLRHRRIPGGPIRQLAGAGLRLPGRDPLHVRRGLQRPRRGPHHQERHLHARGGLVDPGQALGLVERHQLHPPQPPPGDLVLHHRRQLRLRLLLVPLPRRHHRVRGQGHRHRVHQRPPGRRLPVRLGNGAGPRRPVPPAPLRRPAGLRTRRRPGPRRGRGRRSRAHRSREPARQRLLAQAHGLHPRIRGDPRRRLVQGTHLGGVQPANPPTAWATPVGYKLHPAGQPTLLADEDSSIYRARDLRLQGTCG